MAHETGLKFLLLSPLAYEQISVFTLGLITVNSL